MRPMLSAALAALLGCSAVPAELRPGHGFVAEEIVAPPAPGTRPAIRGHRLVVGDSTFCVGPGTPLLGADATPDGEPIVLTASGLHLALNLGSCDDGSCRAHRIPPFLAQGEIRSFLAVKGASLGKDYTGDLLTLHPDRIERHVIGREGAGLDVESEVFLRWDRGSVESFREDPVLGLILETSSGPRRVRHRAWSPGVEPGPAGPPDLNDREADRRLAALRALASAAADPAQVPVLVRMIRGDVPWVSREAALAVARIGAPEGSASALLRLREGVDPVLEAALIRVLECCGVPEGTIDDGSPILRRCALVALRGRVPLEKVVGLLDPGQPALTAEARAELLRRGAMPEAIRTALGIRREEVWAALPELRPHVADALARDPGFVLGVLSRWDPGSWEPSWREGALRILGGPDEMLARKALAALGTVEAGRLRSLRGSPDLRVEALAAHPPGAVLSDEEFLVLRDALGSESPAFRRLAACRALGGARLPPARRTDLLPFLGGMNAMELERILPAFRGIGDGTLASALASNPAIDRLPSAAFRGLWDPPPAEARSFLERAAKEDADRRARLEELGGEVLEGGDARRGRDVLFGPKAECTACHTVRGQGARVGPDLTRIGAQRSRRELLESISFPSAAFAPGYESFRIRVRDGEVYDGFLSRESPTEVVLVQGDRTERRIPKDKVDLIERGSVSIMPQGFGERLRPGELRDLLAFLGTLR